jgi:hypothetical protein
MVVVAAIGGLDRVGEGYPQLLQEHCTGCRFLAWCYFKYAGMEAKERGPPPDQLGQKFALVVPMVSDRELRAIGEDIFLHSVPVEIHEDREVIGVDAPATLQELLQLVDLDEYLAVGADELPVEVLA